MLPYGKLKPFKKRNVNLELQTNVSCSPKAEEKKDAPPKKFKTPTKTETVPNLSDPKKVNVESNVLEPDSRSNVTSESVEYDKNKRSIPHFSYTAINNKSETSPAELPPGYGEWLSSISLSILIFNDF